MKSSDIFDLFFSDIPALLCAGDSYAAAINSAAALRLNAAESEKRLSEYMTPLEALKFQASFESRLPLRIIALKLDNYRGFYAAAAAFLRIMSRRFAVVWLFDTERECSDFCAAVSGSSFGASGGDGMARFMSLLTSVPKELLDEGGRYGLIDLKEAVRRCVHDITMHCEKIDCMVDVTENGEMEKRICSPAPLPLGCFMQMISGMLLCMNEISLNRAIGVRLCAYGDESEVRISADALRLGVGVGDIDTLIKQLPSCAAYLSCAEFAAGMCGCSLSLRRSEDRESVTLILSLSDSKFGTVDFKSRDQFAYYEETLEAVLKQLSRLINLHTEEAPAEE